MHVTVADLQDDHSNGPGVRGQQEQAQPGVVQQAQDQVASGVGDTVCCYCGRPTGRPQRWTWCQWSASAGPARYGPASAGPGRQKALEAEPPKQIPCHSEVCPPSHPQSPRLLISLLSFLTHPPQHIKGWTWPGLNKLTIIKRDVMQVSRNIS